MAQRKNRWFNEGQLLHQGEQRPLGEKRQKMPPRAKVIRSGSYNYSALTNEARAELGSVTPRAVVRGRVELDRKEPEKVAVEYNPKKYGLVRAETLEERMDRHNHEIQRLQEEAEQREKAAFERGLEQGRKEGHEKGVQEMQDTVQAKVSELQRLLDGTVNATRQYFSKVEERLAGFAMSIARRIVGDTAENYREVAVKLASEALQMATERTRVVLRCHPDDYPHLMEAKDELKTISEGIKEVELETSPRLSRGSVVLETVGGSIDASIETMLDEVHKALLPEVDNKVSEADEEES